MLVDTSGTKDMELININNIYQLMKTAARAELILEIARMNTYSSRDVIEELAKKEEK